MSHTILSLLLLTLAQPATENTQTDGYDRLLALHDTVVNGDEDLETLEARLAEIDPGSWARSEKVDYYAWLWED